MKDVCVYSITVFSRARKKAADKIPPQEKEEEKAHTQKEKVGENVKRRASLKKIAPMCQPNL